MYRISLPFVLFLLITVACTPVAQQTPPAANSPVPTHTWESTPILLQFGIWQEDPALFGVSTTPNMVLYADGRLLTGQGTALREGYLTRQEICALLNTIEQSGFLEFDRALYEQALEKMPLGLPAIATIQVSAWKSRSVSLDGLPDFIDNEDFDISPGLRTVYELLSTYQPRDAHPYRAEQIALAFYQYPPDTRDTTVPLWPLQSPSLAELWAQATVKNRFTGKGLLLEGATAQQVYTILQESQQNLFIEGDSVYFVAARYLLPYESLESAMGYQAKLPSSAEAYEPFQISCYASDGVITE